MGCDIHMTYEIRQPDGTWSALDWASKYGDDYSAKWRDPLDLGRNYALFAVLAGVRNHKPPHDFKPIAAPRGLPADASLGAVQDAEDYGVDGHSHSWLTLEEVSGYDYAQTVEYEGVVEEAGFREYVEHGRPSSWCVSMGGAATTVCTNDEMRKMLGYGWSLAGRCTVVRWTETYAEAVGPGWFKALDDLKKYGAGNVRLVFFFDN